MTPGEAVQLRRDINRQRNWVAWEGHLYKGEIRTVWCTRKEYGHKLYGVSSWDEFRRIQRQAETEP